MQPDIITRSATLTPNSYDPATRNFEATVATDAVVRGIALDLASAVIPDRLPLRRSQRPRAGHGRLHARAAAREWLSDHARDPLG